MVICNNMTAADVQRLLPQCDGDGHASSSSVPCPFRAATTVMSAAGEAGEGLRDLRARAEAEEAALSACATGDVNCKLVKKIRAYLAEKLPFLRKREKLKEQIKKLVEKKKREKVRPNYSIAEIKPCEKNFFQLCP